MNNIINGLSAHSSVDVITDAGRSAAAKELAGLNIMLSNEEVSMIVNMIARDWGHGQEERAMRSLSHYIDITAAYRVVAAMLAASKPQPDKAKEDWVRGDWMQTYTGRKFYPMSPDPANIDPVDIAHALSMLCRYNGHVDYFYSVAEHCYLMSHAVPPEDALWALLHDATEAYMGDMIRPLKVSMPEYKAAEDKVMLAICERFGISEKAPESVKLADTRILLTERNTLMRNASHDWEIDDKFEPLDVAVLGLPPMKMRQRYLMRLNELLEIHDENHVPISVH